MRQNSKGDAGSDQSGQSAQVITAALLRNIANIAESCNASAIFVYVDAIEGRTLPLPESLKAKVYYVTRGDEEGKVPPLPEPASYLRVPKVQLSRLGQVKIAIFLALAKGLVKKGDTVVFLSGMAASGTLDTVVVSQVGREYEMFSVSEGEQQTPPEVRPGVIERVTDIASQLGSEGREGRAVGALFVVGDAERVMSLSKQLIINPFRGYPEKDRNILDSWLEETIKELATIDGAFVIRGDGVVESCGVYLKTASQKEFELPRGLGARHHAAAAITAVTNSLAVTVSESTGTVTVFCSGKILTEIEKPRRAGRSAELLSGTQPGGAQEE